MKRMRSFNKKSRIILIASLTSFLVACGGGGGGSSTASATGTPPSVILTIPAKTVPIVTGVATNLGITAKFNQDMLASSINTSSVQLSCPSGAPIAGTVTVAYDAVNRLAVLQHATPLPTSTTCQATITTAATNSVGVALASNYVWTFTTGTGTDTTPPTVTGNSPTSAATGVCLSANVSATFSEPMNASTINATTFTVTNPSNEVMPGVVTYDTLSNTATFAVTNPAGYVVNTVYTTHITTDVKDLAGNALGLANSLVFTTGTAACGASIVTLGTISSYGGYGGGAGATNSGLNTVINGNLGTTGVCSTITGFHDGTDSYTETPLIVGQVTGEIFCAPPAPGTTAKLAIASQAATDARSAYNALVAITPSVTKYDELGGLTLTPGTYSSNSTLHITTGNLTLDAAGNADATWVFQAPSSLTVGLATVPYAANPYRVILINGAQAKNVFWQVYSAARIEDGSTMVGTIIAQAGVTISTAGQALQTTLIGRAIGLDASTTMVNTTITVP